MTFNRTAEGRRRVVDERAKLRHGNNGGRGGREAESAGKKVGRARERDGVGAGQGEGGRGTRKQRGTARGGRSMGAPQRGCSGSASASRELEEGEINGSDRDGHWEWIRRLTGNEVHRRPTRTVVKQRKNSGVSTNF